MNSAAQKPLILITRPEDKGQALAGLLESSFEPGCVELRVAPAQETAALDEPEPARKQINRRSDRALWLFVSTAAVEQGLALLDDDRRALLSGRCIAVGPATGEALRAGGVDNIEVPGDPRSEGLLQLDALQAPEQPDTEVVIVNAAGGRQLLIHELGDRGFRVSEIHVYQRLACEWPDSLWDELEAADPLHVVATSAGAIRTLFDGPSRSRRRALREAHWVLPSERVQVICTGFGVTRIRVAENAGNQALAAAIRAAVADHSPEALL